MQNSLFPRLLLLAVGLSALLLTMAWYLGDPGPVDEARAPATLDGEDLPGRFTAAPGTARESPLQAVERSTFLTEQDGKLTTLSWEVLTPRTDFVSDVAGPRARVELGPGRLLVLEAAEGTVEHPGNDFQRGNFRGGTVATFHRVEDAAAEVSDATAVLRLLLDAPTTFDRELGRLSTSGPVRVTGPRVDLTGEGLELDFSRAEEEVKKLVLDRTDRLRLRRDAAEGSESSPAPPPAAGTPSPGRTPGASPAGATPPASSAPATPPPTIYRVEASGSVSVKSDDGARLAGETLLLFFAAEEGIAPRSEEARGEDKSGRAADRGKKEPETATVRGASEPPTPGAEGSREEGSLFQPGPGTVELAWTGPLRLRPAEDGEGPDAVRAPGFSGAHLQLAGAPGSPATAASGEAAIGADRLAYATADGRLLATGTPDQPVRARDPAAGRLTARTVEATPEAGTAIATGPGELRAVGPADGGTEETLRIGFREAMRLAFDPANGGDDRRDVVLREAVFTGSVSVLASTPADAGESGGTPIDAGGGPLTLDASRVTLGFTDPPPGGDDAGRPTPEFLLAGGGVTASRAAVEPDAPAAWTLASEALRVALVPVSPADDADAPGTTFEIDGLEATGGVVVRTSGEAEAQEGAEPVPLRLASDRLTASPRLDRVELNGSPDAPATAERGGVTLTGGTVVAGLTGDRLEVRGPGSLDRLASSSTDEGDATRLTWTDSLRYDGATGEAEALGRTLTTSASATERRRIEAGDVRASFPPGAERSGDGAAPDTGFANLRRLRAVAPEQGGNPRVVVVAETLGPAGEVVTTLRAEGPRLDLDVLPEDEGGNQLLTMPGPGRLILVDDSPPPPEEGAGSGAGGPGVRLAGRGATFFRWNDALRLDGRTRDAELTGSVFMNHDARDGSPRVKLYGDRLLAAFTPEGETAPAGDAGADLRSVRIDGNVVVEQEDRTITADHLSYLTGTEEVQLWSDAGRGMVIHAAGRPLRADSATWNLTTDRVDVRGVSGTSEPIR